MTDAARNHEIGGYNCNYYTCALHEVGTGAQCSHNSWHGKSPPTGDLAVLGSHNHIGIVTKVSGSKVLIVSGNTLRPDESSGPADAVAAHWVSISSMWGFASPVG